jgi:hypothetical protein
MPRSNIAVRSRSFGIVFPSGRPGSQTTLWETSRTRPAMT